MSAALRTWLTGDMQLNGSLQALAWNHTRGYVPLVAAAQRFEDLFEGVEISWHKRSLKNFGDESLEELVSQFQLLVIDHPHIGHLASRQLLLPLEEHFSWSVLDDLRRNETGKSFDSYWFANRLWALPIDAAAPVSSWRPDLMSEAGVTRPETWDELRDLALKGFVALPATPVDSLMNFFMLCCGLGEEPFGSRESVVSSGVGVEALALLRDLVQLCSPRCFERNPIQTYREMAMGNNTLYCPFAFGYSNYARSEYVAPTLDFGGLVKLDGRPLRSTLGGAGIAVSPSCQNLDLALAFVGWLVSGDVQRSLYFQVGGQPAHRSAWQDPEVNRACNNYFLKTLEVVEAAYLRPREDGYVRFQNLAGPVVHDFLRQGGNPIATLDAMEEIRAYG